MPDTHVSLLHLLIAAVTAHSARHESRRLTFYFVVQILSYLLCVKASLFVNTW